MIAIIPALLRSQSDVEALTRTLAAIPADIVNRCVIAGQGLPPVLASRPSREYVVLQREAPSTKWGAITRVLQEVGTGGERVLLIDADDPFEATSLRDFCLHGAASKLDCVIGRRNHIALTAQDQRSTHSRSFIEIFSNTLLLIRLGLLAGTRTGPDIQSGLYVLSSEALCSANFDHVGPYGGELTLYHHVIVSGGDVEEKSVRANPAQKSSYLAREIIRQTLELPFLAVPSEQEIDLALREGPRVYAELMPGSDELYRHEMRDLLETSATPRTT